MSNSNDHELVKKCYRCESSCSGNNFYKNKSKKDGVNSFCKFCLNDYMKVFIKNRIKTHVNLRLFRNTRRRIHHALYGKSNLSSTNEILGIDIATYRKGIENQFTPELNWFKR